MHHSSPEALEESFDWRLVSQGPPRGVIDLLLDFIDVLLSDFAHIGVPWKVSSDDPIHVLDPSFLPRSIWVTEIGLDAIL